LNIVDLWVEDGRLTVEIRGQRIDMANSMSTRTEATGQRVVVAVGDQPPNPAAHPANATTSVVRPFDPTAFDPDIGAAMLRYLIYRSADEFGLTLLKYALGRTLVRMHWPSWSKVPRDRRRRFLEQMPAIRARLEINGAVAVRTNPLRVILGRGPIVTDPADAERAADGGVAV
jgi:hypothetical protein